MSVMDDFVEWASIRFADGLERTVSGIADTEKIGHLVAVGDAEDGARFVLISHRRMPRADAQAGGRDHHRHRRLTAVVLVGPLSAFTRWFGDHEGDRGRRARDMTG